MMEEGSDAQRRPYHIRILGDALQKELKAVLAADPAEVRKTGGGGSLDSVKYTLHAGQEMVGTVEVWSEVLMDPRPDREIEDAARAAVREIATGSDNLVIRNDPQSGVILVDPTRADQA